MSSLKECPFRYQWQYEDGETGLYYNRFRYYDSSTGTYLSQDPIRLNGGFTLYSYVHDLNWFVDIWGLEDLWFRALNNADMNNLDQGLDITAKVPTATQPVSNHVAFGSENWYPGDQYISVTRNQLLAEKWALDSGTDVAIIDMDKVTNRKIDLSTKAGRDLNILSEKGVKPNIKKDAMRYSEMMEEGLVEGQIQKGAITKRYTPNGH